MHLLFEDLPLFLLRALHLDIVDVSSVVNLGPNMFQDTVDLVHLVGMVGIQSRLHPLDVLLDLGH